MRVPVTGRGLTSVWAESSGEFPDGAAELQLGHVVERLQALRDLLDAAGRRHAPELEQVAPACRAGALNLVHYLELRRHELRPLQDILARMGLSSLGRAEAHVWASVDATLGMARAALQRTGAAGFDAAVWDAGTRDLQQGLRHVLGAPRGGRQNLIMVTLPSLAAEQAGLVDSLLAGGMDCARINCAHDGPEQWRAMIEHLRMSPADAGRRCRVLMDLPGPKLRTGALTPGPPVIRVRPHRDACGQVLRPARIWLTPAAAPCPPPQAADAVVPVLAIAERRLRPGARLRFHDARESKRCWNVVQVDKGGWWAESAKTCYLMPDLELSVEAHPVLRIASIPPREQALLLRPGELLILHGRPEPGVPAQRDADGTAVEPATIGCTLPEVLDDVEPGHAVWFDDGRIGGTVESKRAGELRIRIAHAAPRGSKLRSDKGINFPDSELRLDALTCFDLQHLDFVATHADAVALSFVTRAADVQRLQEELRRRGRADMPMVLKIETRSGFERLPELLLAAMRTGPCGVMIARGDLAIECGFERMAEVQEEILWMCEAARLPVIWATQVLETLAKSGQPSRAEITDAAMSHRAECVMLNKGAFVVDAVRALDDILMRMRGHQSKKMSMLRPLSLAQVYWARSGAPGSGHVNARTDRPAQGADRCAVSQDSG